LKRLLVLGLVTSLAMALLASAASAAPPVMVDVCHFNSLGEWQVNTLRAKGKGIEAHLAHGDALPGEPVPGMADYEFDPDCQPVLILGSIVITKATNPSGGTGFGFTDNISAPNSFTLDDGQSETFTNVVPGTYAVSETVLPGWDLTSATCDDGSAPSAIVVSAGETVTCTFTNSIPPDLQLVKDDGGVSVQAGETVVYTLTFANIGGDATGVVVEDTVPTNTTFDAAASTGGWSCADGDPAGTVCTIAVGSVAGPSGGGLVTFAAKVDRPIAPGVVLIANAAAISDDGAGGSDPNPADNFSTAITPLTVPDLQLVKDDGGVSVQAGETVVYTLTFANIGGDATGVVVEDTVPTNTTFDAAASTGGWSCADGDPAGTVCTIAVGSVAGPSGGGLVTFAAKVDRPIAPGVVLIANAAAISDDGAGGSDPNPADNFSTAITPLTVPPETIFAVAYTDIVDDGGAYDPAVDVLIAKLVDGPVASPDGVIGVGDIVVTDRYPKAYDGSLFGNFLVNTHTVTGVITPTSVELFVFAGVNLFRWNDGPLFDQYVEDFDDFNTTFFVDVLFDAGAGSEQLIADPGSPSSPDEMSIFIFNRPHQATDDAFIDVEITLP